MTRAAICLVALLSALCLARPAESVGPPPAPEAPSVRCARACLPSVLYVRVAGKGSFGEPREGGGSAFAVGPRRALTCLHVVAGMDTVTAVTAAGKEHAVTVGATSEALDLAVLALPEGCRPPALPWGRSAGLAPGTPLMAIGSPWGHAHSVSLGVLSHPSRAVTYDGREHRGLLQTDAAINPGNSGGPLLTLDGRVVGVVAAQRTNAEGMGFAVPSDAARKWLGSLKE